MSGRPESLRLRRLIDESLHRFSDIVSNTLTEEIEKDLLIALSQVFRQVQQLIDESGSDEELSEDPSSDSECLIDAAAHSEDRHCLGNIIGDLVFLLSVNSRYAQHLTGNILVAISRILLLESGGDWDAFIHLLCLSLEFAIRNILKASPVSAFGEYLNLNPSIISSLELRLKNADWSTVAAISRVLRNVQKYLKRDSDDKCLEAYLNHMSSLQINFPWDLLRENFVCHKEVIQSREIIMLFGSFIQLICSLVSLSSSLEDGLDSQQALCRIADLVPKLAPWCQVELQSLYHVRIYHYFRHKVLMLMVKLSTSIHIGQTISTMWMRLLREYFEDLLLQPISGGKLDQSGFLEESPFCTSILDPEKQSVPSCHLQRLAILLFLKCSLNLKLDSECSNNIGLAELHKWLQYHVPHILSNDELYSERCMRFELSFLQLFMQEDDILFEALLQLLDVPLLQENQIIKEKTLLAADLFNPIHLFHLFLAEINYDHQVLLDYLISKDTGSTSAEYILRSLRIICNSWSLFVEFPGVRDDSGQVCVKRRKVEEEGKLGNAHGKQRCVDNELPFMAAKDCLASLTTSIDSLNKKRLFPYNPDVLLRRLMKFQELSIKQ